MRFTVTFNTARVTRGLPATVRICDRQDSTASGADQGVAPLRSGPCGAWGALIAPKDSCRFPRFLLLRTVTRYGSAARACTAAQSPRKVANS